MRSRRYRLGAAAGILHRDRDAGGRAGIDSIRKRPDRECEQARNDQHDGDPHGPRAQRTGEAQAQQQPQLPRRGRAGSVSRPPRRSTSCSGARSGPGTTRPARHSTVTSFLSGAGNSSWLNSVTQYCQGVASGTISCGSSGRTQGTRPSMYGGSWCDNGSAAPSSPTQSQLAAEAVRRRGALRQHGRAARTTDAVRHRDRDAQQHQRLRRRSAAHGTARLVLELRQHRLHEHAVHDRCGRHVRRELQRPRPEGRDHDRRAAMSWPRRSPTSSRTAAGSTEAARENGDKCAWISSGQGASAKRRSERGTFPVQSLWSNAFNSGSGGCVLSY